LEFAGAIYYLTSRGNARQKMFFTDADRDLFLNTLSGVVSRYHWICHAYICGPVTLPGQTKASS
jgi:putative transposase